MPSCPLTITICLGGSCSVWWEAGTVIGVEGFSWEGWAFKQETCLSPAGHCDLHPPFPLKSLISSPVTPSSFCLPIFLPHLEMSLGCGWERERVSERAAGQGSPGRYHSRGPAPKLPHIHLPPICPQGKETSHPPIWVPIFLPKEELPYPHVLPLPEKPSFLV